MDDTISEEKISLAVKEEVRRMQTFIKAHVESKDIRLMFFPLSSANNEVNDIVVEKFIKMIEKMSMREKERTITELSLWVFEETNFRLEIEILVDDMLYEAIEQELITLSVCLEALVTTCDFTLRTRISAEKFERIKLHLHKLDYKGVRAVFKRIIDIQMSRLPQILSVDQRRMMVPVEELLLYIMDRRSNVFPALFAITEINRTPNKRMFMFPRLAASATYLENSFRPLAELAYIIGRCFLFPLPSHIAFTASAPAFRIDSSTSTLIHRSIIPYREELYMPQTYLLYMILRQPKGKDNLNGVLKITTNKLQLEELIAVLISETMAAVEALRPNEEIPRYQWENIFHIFFYEVSNSQCNFPKMCRLLTATLTKTGYRRGRDELMWIVLQFCGQFVQQLTSEYLDAVVQLYRVVYSDEDTWTGASDHPMQMVRFLAPACLWILMEGKEKENLPAPTGSLANQIDFVKGGLERITEDATLAILANACRFSDRQLERPAESDICREVGRQLQLKIEGLPTDEPFLLSYGRQAGSKTLSLSIDFLDSLTIRSKQHLMGLCLKTLFKTDRPPSFAALDTCAKLMQMMEYEHAAKLVILSYFPKSISMVATQQVQGQIENNRDQLHMYTELLSFRLAGLQINYTIKQPLIMQCISAMTKSEIQNCSQLYFAFEHLLMRQWTWIPFVDCLSLAQNLMKPSSKLVVVNFLLNVNTFSNLSTNDANHLSVTPEVVKLYFITLFRTCKVLGTDLAPDMISRICMAYPLPSSLLFSMPSIVAENNNAIMQSAEEELRNRHQILTNAVHEDYVTLRTGGLSDENVINYYQRHDRGLTLLCVICRYLLEDQNACVSPTFYSILENMHVKAFVVCTNALVDFVISEILMNREMFPNFVNTLNRMVYQWQVISIDRLFLALALHPQGDDAAHYAIQVINSLISLKETNERIVAYTHSVPPSMNPTSSDFCRKLVDYHKKYPELSYSESAARVSSMSQQNDPINPKAHLPVYYGSCIERMLPTVDFILTRVMELRMHDEVFNNILGGFAPLYKYHPAPISYLYTVLFTLHEHIGQTQWAKHFAQSIMQGAEVTEAFTNSFLTFNHQKPLLKDIVGSLVERVVTASEFVLKPPPYVAQDWRFAELPPAGQALYMACCEIMASPQSPEAMISAFVNLLCSRPLPRPFVTLNAVALIITALPNAYATRIYAEIVAVLNSGALKEMSVSQIGFENFEESCLLSKNTRVLAVIALTQAYWQHSNLAGLSNMLNLFEKDLRSLVRTEKELIFVLRIIVPLLQRSYDARDRSRQIDDCLRLVNCTYRMIGDVSSQYELEYEDTICDLLYHFKYMYVGDFVREEAEEAMSRMRPSLQMKLKFINPLNTHPESEKHEESDRERDLGRLTGKISVDLTSIQNLASSINTSSLPSM